MDYQVKDLTKCSLVDDALNFFESWAEAFLMAQGQNGLTLIECPNDFVAFANARRHRFFQQYVQSALCSGDGKFCMGVRRCCDDDRVEPFLSEHFSIIGVIPRRSPSFTR